MAAVCSPASLLRDGGLTQLELDSLACEKEVLETIRVDEDAPLPVQSGEVDCPESPVGFALAQVRRKRAFGLQTADEKVTAPETPPAMPSLGPRLRCNREVQLGSPPLKGLTQLELDEFASTDEGSGSSSPLGAALRTIPRARAFVSNGEALRLAFEAQAKVANDLAAEGRAEDDGLAQSVLDAMGVESEDGEDVSASPSSRDWAFDWAMEADGLAMPGPEGMGIPQGGLDSMGVSSGDGESPSSCTSEEQEGGDFPAACESLFALRRRRAFVGRKAAESFAADVFRRYCESQGVLPASAHPGTLCTTQEELEELCAAPLPQPYASREELDELCAELGTPKGNDTSQAACFGTSPTTPKGKSGCGASPGARLGASPGTTSEGGRSAKSPMPRTSPSSPMRGGA